jgi:hypothetical protein
MDSVSPFANQSQAWSFASGGPVPDDHDSDDASGALDTSQAAPAPPQQDPYGLVDKIVQFTRSQYGIGGQDNTGDQGAINDHDEDDQ